VTCLNSAGAYMQISIYPDQGRVGTARIRPGDGSASRIIAHSLQVIVRDRDETLHLGGR
jgi:hypothetical protein